MTCSSTAVIPITVVPSRPPDAADRLRCTTFMPFIHKSTRSSNAPIPGTLRAATTCRCPPQMPLTAATGAWRPAFSAARPGVLSPRLSDGGVRRVRCACPPNPRRSDCSCTSVPRVLVVSYHALGRDHRVPPGRLDGGCTRNGAHRRSVRDHPHIRRFQKWRNRPVPYGSRTVGSRAFGASLGIRPREASLGRGGAVTCRTVVMHRVWVVLD